MPDLTEAQTALVAALVGEVPHPSWLRLFLNAEILEQPDGYDLDTLAFAIRRDGTGRLEDPQLRLGPATRAAIVGLYEALEAAQGSRLGSFDLVVDFPGRYRFELSYDPPKRLNGIWDREREQWLESYLERYAAEGGEA